jgi:hypothetical protein
VRYVHSGKPSQTSPKQISSFGQVQWYFGVMTTGLKIFTTAEWAHFAEKAGRIEDASVLNRASGHRFYPSKTIDSLGSSIGVSAYNQANEPIFVTAMKKCIRIQRSPM